jgi:hypothetical protein
VSIIDKLLNRLTRKYDRSPAPILGLRLSYMNGGMTWAIADDVLTTNVVGGIGSGLTIDLSQYTLSTLATYLASQPGYVVLYLDQSPLAFLSGLALIESSGDINTSNGDHIYVATNPNWAYMSACSAELDFIRQQIDYAPREMATTTADSEWLDLIGSYYAVPRSLNELDSEYGPRIPAEVILPRQNNVAIEIALQAATGQPATVTNAVVYGNPEPRFDGATRFDGSHLFNASAQRIFNLFDVAIGYDLLGSLNPAGFMTSVRNQIDRLRAAGTHLRNLTLTSSSVMSDFVNPPTDSLVEQLLSLSLIGTGSSSNSGILVINTLQTAPSSINTGIGRLTTGEHLTQVFAGAGSFTGFATIITHGSGIFAGAGSMTLSAVNGNIPAAALLQGAGSFTGDAIPTQFATATLSGAGGFFGDAKKFKFTSASLSGSGGFTGRAVVVVAARASLNGAGQFIATATARPIDPFTSVFVPTFGGP